MIIMDYNPYDNTFQRNCIRNSKESLRKTKKNLISFDEKINIFPMTYMYF